MNRHLATDEYERMDRSDASRPPRLGRRLVVELLMMGGVFAIYRQIRFLTRNDTDAAMDNARARRRLRAAVPLLLRAHRAGPGHAQPHARRILEPVLRHGALPLDRRVPPLGVLPSPQRLPPDQEHLRQRHRRRPGDPRRVPTGTATHAARRRLRRHAPALRPAHLQHRHLGVGRQPVRGDAVAALRMGVHRRRCVREHPSHPPELVGDAAPGDHAAGHRRHGEPLLARRRRCRCSRRRRRRPCSASAANVSSRWPLPAIAIAHRSWTPAIPNSWASSLASNDRHGPTVPSDDWFAELEADWIRPRTPLGASGRPTTTRYRLSAGLIDVAGRRSTAGRRSSRSSAGRTDASRWRGSSARLPVSSTMVTMRTPRIGRLYSSVSTWCSEMMRIPAKQTEREHDQGRREVPTTSLRDPPDGEHDGDEPDRADRCDGAA